ncbi:uncharacterized protein LOC113483950 [Athene cunicularia]|uniref:uncharacterized protein LOC113483950 n=1 Tax=Athene cunicularia TaxID=194338 RepID=UPI000EF66C9E|nr:uncharacterized protein LOC113483950 [Athene cunicularia]
MLPPPALVPAERAASAGGSNGFERLLMGRDGGGSRRGCGFCLRQSRSCLCPVSARKMLSGLLLRLLLTTALCPGLLGTVSVQNLHLCEGYMGPGGRYHPGFYCPRLSDPAGHRYCCWPSPHALKSCCSQPALEALSGVNLSSLAGPGLLRNPLALPFVGNLPGRPGLLGLHCWRLPQPAPLHRLRWEVPEAPGKGLEDYAKAETDASKGTVSGGWQGTGLCTLLLVWVGWISPGPLR